MLVVQRAAFVFLLATGWVSATAPPADTLPAASQEFTVGLRVGIDATGKVRSSQPVGTGTIPVLVQAAAEIAGKLVFTPATRDGVPAASEVTLFMILSLNPKPDGQFAIAAKKTVIGPNATKVAAIITPEYQQGRSGAMVVVSVALQPDGSPDMDSFKTESVALGVPSKFGERRYVDAIKASLAGSRFMLDKVAGVDVLTRVTLPYRFGGGARKHERGEKDDKDTHGIGDEVAQAKVESLVPGVVLPSLPAATAH